MAKNLLSTKNLCFWAALVVAFFYQTYRYPLEYGIEPPLTWRIGKYALLTGLCLLSLPKFLGQLKKFRIFEWGVLAVFSILAVFGSLQQEKLLVQAALCGLIAFWLARSCEKLSYRSLLLFLLVAWVVDTAFYLVEAIGLVVFAKPFASSGDSILTSRFGGMLVEPLGAPYLSMLFLGVALEFTGYRRWLIALSSALAILMTQTMTAALFLTVAVSMFFVVKWLLHFMDSKLAFLTAPFLLVLMIAGGIIGFGYFVDHLPFWTGKWSSVQLHVSYWWPTRWPWFPTEGSAFSETWWVFAIQSMGILWTVAYLSLMVVLLRDCIRRRKSLLAPRGDGTYQGVFVGIYLSSAFVIFGSLNQLYLGMYPVGLLFMLFAFLVKYYKISEDALQANF